MKDAINRLYRMIFCRGGYGVHSPFVFDIITTVIEEKRLYYCYERLNLVRELLLENREKVVFNNRGYTVKEFLKRFCFSEREDRLLFRLANRFQPRTIYVLGSDLGLAPLYLTSWSESAVCTVIESEPSLAAIAQKNIVEHSSASIDFHATINPKNTENRIIDFIVLGKTFSIDAFESFLPYINDNSIIVISGIHSSEKNRNIWKKVCTAPKVTVTIDLYSLGIVFFNPKLHRKTYIN